MPFSGKHLKATLLVKRAINANLTNVGRGYASDRTKFGMCVRIDDWSNL